MQSGNEGHNNKGEGKREKKREKGVCNGKNPYLISFFLPISIPGARGERLGQKEEGRGEGGRRERGQYMWLVTHIAQTFPFNNYHTTWSGEGVIGIKKIGRGEEKGGCTFYIYLK